MVQKEKQPLNFFEHLDDITAKIAQRNIVIFLDYDGTLTPIVKKPELALLSEEMKGCIQRLSQLYPVSIVSGRATDDVRSKVDIDQLFYAGSHGFEIVDPQGQVKINEEAQKIRPIIDEVAQKLTDRVELIPGALIEHVKYTVSAHYRLVEDTDFVEFEKCVNEILEEYPMLRKTSGKKVFEIRPKINWNKGKAVEWILQSMSSNTTNMLPVYIGDDVTDEDAFRAIKDIGVSIVVLDSPRKSIANYQIKNTEEVKSVLELFITFRMDTH